MKEIKVGSKYRYSKLALLAADLENANKLALICANKLIRATQCVVNDLDFEQGCKEYYSAIVNSADKGITSREMGRIRPFAKHQQQDHAAIIESLMKAGKIEYMTIPKSKQGRLRRAYIVTGLPDSNEQKPSTFKSIYWDNSIFKWIVQAKTRKDNVEIPLGRYDTEEEAVKKYNEFTAEHPGKFPVYSK